MAKRNNDHPLLRTTAYALTAMSIYNISQLKKATAKNIHKRDDLRSYSGRFGEILYRKEGKGTPLLLIHDLDPASNCYEWNNAIPELSKKYSVYAIDLPGCGNSDKTNTEYSVYMYALAINDFIKGRILRGRTDVSVDAISSGCSASLLITAAALDGSIYRSIGLVNPSDKVSFCSKFIVDSNLKRAFRFIINTPIVGTFIYNLFYCRRHLNEEINNSGYSRLKSDDRAAQIDAMYEASHLGGFGSKFLFSSIEGGLMAADTSRLLKKLTCHCSIYTGEYSENIDELMNKYLLIRPDINLCTIPCCSLPQFEHPEALLRELSRESSRK